MRSHWPRLIRTTLLLVAALCFVVGALVLVARGSSGIGLGLMILGLGALAMVAGDAPP